MSLRPWTRALLGASVLAAGTFAAAWSAGHALTPDEALTEVMAFTPDSPASNIMRKNR